MAVYLRWPEKLPRPLLKKHSITPGNPLIDTKMDSGYSKVRRRFESVPDTMPSSWLFSDVEASLFNGFYEHALNAGANSFVMPVLLPEGLIDHVVRFKPPIKKLQPLSKKLWSLDANLWIERRFVWDANNTTMEYLEPKSIQDVVESTDSILDTYPG